MQKNLFTSSTHIIKKKLLEQKKRAINQFTSHTRFFRPIEQNSQPIKTNQQWKSIKTYKKNQAFTKTNFFFFNAAFLIISCKWYSSWSTLYWQVIDHKALEDRIVNAVDWSEWIYSYSISAIYMHYLLVEFVIYLSEHLWLFDNFVCLQKKNEWWMYRESIKTHRTFKNALFSNCFTLRTE